MYLGSSDAAFCHGKQPVRHTKRTMPNCHTSCEETALEFFFAKYYEINS